MTIKLTNQVRIQKHQDFWYAVEDTHFDVGCEGCTISYWQDTKRHTNITMEPEEALAVADAIYKLFKKN